MTDYHSIYYIEWVAQVSGTSIHYDHYTLDCDKAIDIAIKKTYNLYTKLVTITKLRLRIQSNDSNIVYILEALNRSLDMEVIKKIPVLSNDECLLDSDIRIMLDQKGG